MVQNTAILLSTACCPPVQYFTKLLLYETVYLEQHENFIKQTYRNRYQILGVNGPVSLVVPVIKGRGRKIRIKDLQISYDTQWQRNHWRTIFSAYNSSPFFEYYKDDIHHFFEKKWKFLFEYNQEILEIICDLLELKNPVMLTDDFEKMPANTLNFREAISPKIHKSINDVRFNPHPYTQVFSEKLGFAPNLSILDLLFNEGPNSLNVLGNSTKQTG